MNLREFKAKLSKFVDQAYTLLEQVGDFDENSPGIQIDEKDIYKQYERVKAWEIIEGLEDIIKTSELLLSKPNMKGHIKRNKEGKYFLNSKELNSTLEEKLEVLAWNNYTRSYEWKEVFLEEGNKGVLSAITIDKSTHYKARVVAENINGKEARLKDHPPILSKIVN